MQSSARSAYQHTLDYLYSRLPMFSRIGAAALKPDLSNTISLCNALGNPERKLKCIHIAGTNGKGSTSHMLAAVFQQTGYKTGLYTSPHLIDFRERIRINGEPVSETFVIDFVEKNKAVIESIEPSFFEITVAMAFAAFEQEAVDIAIIETGLGGRLDSTNVITPELSIITNISLDHTDLLGDSIAAIAKEKAGIIKPDIPVLIGPSVKEALDVFIEVAMQNGSRLFEAKNEWLISRKGSAGNGLHHFIAQKKSNDSVFEIHTDLGGNYQQDNIATVLTAVEILQNIGWQISINQAIEALKLVKKKTGLHGRWEILQEQPFIVADVAHNPAGLQYVLEDFQEIMAQSKHIVVGFVRDKDVKKALSLFPKDALYHFCAANIPRALPVEELALLASGMGLKGTTHHSVKDAFISAKCLLKNEDALLITGSFFIVGEVLTDFI